MSNTIKEALYVSVAEHISSCNGGVTRSDIGALFPDVDPKRLTKALENACAKRLIHSVERGVYRGGPRPAGASTVRRTSDDSEPPEDTAHILQSALNSRPPLECAWLNFKLIRPAEVNSPRMA